jgi:phosphoglycerate kinase
MINYLSRANKKSLGTALLRLDFNTEDDWRMRAVLPTLRFLLKNSLKIVIVSHRGRPDPGLIRANKTMPVAATKKFGLKEDAVTLSRLLGKKVTFIEHFRFEEIRADIKKAPAGSLFLLENLRFLPGEEKNDPKLAKTLASLADFYVNDAFAVSHRANASVAAITKFLPSYAGLELEDEIKSLSHVMTKPKHPLVIILGGAKAADKLSVISYFKKKADSFLLGGGPANTILAMRGVDVKKSLKDDDANDVAAMKKIARYPSVVVPDDFIWRDGMILDLGSTTLRTFGKKIGGAKTILWSGPIGDIDRKPFDRGSAALAREIAKNKTAFSVAGGGETVMFLKKIRMDKKFSFVSTGGGAMMDFLAGEKLPGIEALKTSKRAIRF